jgi:hypothetical protein
MTASVLILVNSAVRLGAQDRPPGWLSFRCFRVRNWVHAFGLYDCDLVGTSTTLGVNLVAGYLSGPQPNTLCRQGKRTGALVPVSLAVSSSIELDVVLDQIHVGLGHIVSTDSYFVEMHAPGLGDIDRNTVFWRPPGPLTAGNPLQ